MNRNKRATVASETVDIVQQGSYELDGVGRIDISPLVGKCLSGTTLWRPEDLEKLLGRRHSAAAQTRFDVRNETTLAAAYRLVVEQRKSKTLCLNFASAKNPGGGFLGGSQAQEESLARSSALYASLQAQPDYYTVNRACGTALYTDHMIHSPHVPVLRNDAGDLLPEPYVVGMLTAPAVNAGAVHKHEPHNVAQILPTMARRIEMVLAVAALHGYEHLVLAAWGCGVFRNEPEVIAKLFAGALVGAAQFAGVFQGVTFSVLDTTPAKSIVGSFQHCILHEAAT